MIKPLIGASLLVLFLQGCTVERVGPPGPVVSHVRPVAARDVATFARLEDVPGVITVVEDLVVRDDGDSTPRALEDRLRVMAGARGANAIVLDPFNRMDNQTRVAIGAARDRPFETFRATAIWFGDAAIRPTFGQAGFTEDK